MVEFQDVCRDYVTGWLPRRSLRAVDHVSFRIEPGEVFGLLGPNRAGKTTLVKLLLSLCRPTSGQVVPARQAGVGPLDAGARRLRPREPRLPRATSPAASCSASTGPCRSSRTRSSARASRSCSRWSAWPTAPATPSARYSKGMVQRLGMAQALLAEPDLLVLDEPTEGLDLSGRRLLRDVVKKQKARGGTVVLVDARAERGRDAVRPRGGASTRPARPRRPVARADRRGRSLEQALSELYSK